MEKSFEQKENNLKEDNIVNKASDTNHAWFEHAGSPFEKKELETPEIKPDDQMQDEELNQKSSGEKPELKNEIENILKKELGDVLTPEEVNEALRRRNRNFEKEAVWKALNNILKETGFTLAIDPRSPIGNPQFDLYDARNTNF